MRRKRRKETIKIGKYEVDRVHLFKGFIVLLHLAGVIGMAIPSVRPFFKFLTPFHLILCTLLILFFHRDWRIAFFSFSLLAFFIGFGSEVLGVKTGLIFGDYNYGNVLGLKWLEVPLIIGVNWFLLVYITGELFNLRIENDWLAAGMGALLMVMIDFIIEPVAIGLDYWQWHTDNIPFSNYYGWFAIAFLIHLIYRKLDFRKKNPLATFLLINLILFFTVLTLIV